MMSAFRTWVDVFSRMASEMFGMRALSETELTPKQRNVVQPLLKYTRSSLAGKANGALHNQEVHGW